MEHRDYLKKQIDQLGQVLGKIFSDLLGFKKYGTVSNHGPTIPLKLTNSLSSTAQTIIKNDGYDYKTTT